MLEDGYLRLRGRLKEMIIRGGENISPYEIEEVLLAHPQVAEAVGFGVDDDKYGETVAAAVVLRGDVGAEELRRARRGARSRRSRCRTASTSSTRSRRRRPARCSARAWPRDLRGAGGVRFAVLGAGAIGAYVGAALAQGGAAT